LSESGSVSEADAEKLLKDSWELLEQICASQLSPSVRKSIVEIVRNYVNETHEEYNSPLEEKVLNHIEALQNAAKSFKDVFKDVYSGGATSRAARILVNTELKILAPGGPDLPAIGSALSKLQAACRRAATVLKHTPGFVVGDAWARMVRRLTQLFKTEDLPTGASHDGSSRFVNFLDALQKGLPKHLRRHTGIDKSSLAKAIHRARRLGSGDARTFVMDNEADAGADSEIFTNAIRS